MIPKIEKPAIRHRVEIACTRCRYRKTRCCGSKPSCQTCLKFKKECVYVSIEDSKTTPRGVYTPRTSGGTGRADKRRSLTLSSEAEGEMEAAIMKGKRPLAQEGSLGQISSLKSHRKDPVQPQYETLFSTISSSVLPTSSDAYAEPIEHELGGYVEPGVFFHNQPVAFSTYEESCGSASPLESITYLPVYQSSPPEGLPFPVARFQNQPELIARPNPEPEPYVKPIMELHSPQINQTPAFGPMPEYQSTPVSLSRYTQQFSPTFIHPLHLRDSGHPNQPSDRTTGRPLAFDNHKYRQSPASVPDSVSGPVPVPIPSPMLSTYQVPPYPALPLKDEPLGVVGWCPETTAQRNSRPEEHEGVNLAWGDLLR